MLLYTFVKLYALLLSCFLHYHDNYFYSYVLESYINDVVWGVNQSSDIGHGPACGDWSVVKHLHWWVIWQDWCQ